MTIETDPLSPGAELVMHILYAAGGALHKDELRRRFVELCRQHGTPEKALAAFKAGEVRQ